MTLLIIEGFERWSGSDVGTEVALAYNTNLSDTQLDITSGRKSGNAIQGTLSLNGVYGIDFPTTTSSEDLFVIGFAWKCSYTGGNQHHIATFYDADGSIMLTFGRTGGNLFKFTRGAINFATIDTGTTVFLANQWYFFECKILFSQTVGTYELRINGTTEFSGTGTDTTATTYTTPSYIRVGHAISGQAFILDDVYILDDAGSNNTDLLGDVVVQGLTPNGNGTTNNFTGSDADSTDNYLHVDEVPADDDTSYNESSTASHKDLYAYSAIGTSTANIYGVGIKSLAKKTEAGARTMVNVTRSSASEADSSAYSPNTTYAYFDTIQETDPNTAAAWTEAGVNAAEFGVKVAS